MNPADIDFNADTELTRNLDDLLDIVGPVDRMSDDELNSKLAELVGGTPHPGGPRQVQHKRPEDVIVNLGSATPDELDQLEDFQNLSRVISATDIGTTPPEELQARNALWLRAARGLEDPKGAMFFGEELDPHTLAARIQNTIDPKRYAEQFKSDFRMYREMDESGQEKMAYEQMKTLGLIPAREAIQSTDRGPAPIQSGGVFDQEMGAITPGYTPTIEFLHLEDMSPKQRKEMRERYAAQLLEKDYVSVRSGFEASLNPQTSEAVRRCVAEGQMPEEVISMFPPEEQSAAVSYFNLLRSPSDWSLPSEIGVRTTRASWDIVAGGVEYVGWQALRGALSIPGALTDAEGANWSNKWLGLVEKVRKEKELTKAASTIKFVERGFVGKALTGLADTVPYMLAVSSGIGGTFLAGSAMAKEADQAMRAAGVDAETSGMAAPIVAAVNLMIEKIQVGQAVSAFKGMSQAQVSALASRTLIRKILERAPGAVKAGVSTYTQQTGEEVLQAWTQEFATQAGLGEADLAAFYDIAAETVEEVGPVMTLFALAGVGGHVRSQVKYDAEIIERDMNLKAAEAAANEYQQKLEENWDTKAEFDKAYAAWNEVRDSEDVDMFLQGFANPEEAQTEFEEEADRRAAQQAAAEEMREEELADFAPGITVEEAQATVDDLGFSVPVEVVQTTADLPRGVQRAEVGKGVYRVEGANRQGMVYIVADNLPDSARAKKVIIHEAVGHVGLEAVFGEKFTQFVDQILAQADLREGIEGAATSLNLDMNDPAQAALATREYLAQRAESTRYESTLWNKIVSTARKWLRQFGANIEWSENDITNLFISAEAAARAKHRATEAMTEEEAELAAEDVPTFSRKAKDPLRNASVVMAHRITTGKTPGVRAVKTFMKKAGLDVRQAAEVLQKAHKIAKEYRDTVDAAKADTKILDRLHEAEIRQHYAEIIDEIHRSGVKEGAVFERAKEVSKRAERALLKEALAGRRGVDIEAAGLEVPTTMEEFDAFLTRLEQVVREQLIKDGVFTARRTTYAQDPQFRQQIKYTVSNMLERQIKTRTIGTRKRQLLSRLKAFRAAQQYGRIVNEARDLMISIDKASIRQSAAVLNGQFQDLIAGKGIKAVVGGEEVRVGKSSALRKRVQAGKELQKRDIDPVVQKTVKFVKALNSGKNRLTKSDIKDIVSTLDDFINSGTVIDSTKLQDTLDKIRDRVPELDKFIAGLDATEAPLMLRRVLSDYGYFQERTTVEKAEAVDKLVKDIDGGIEKVQQALEERRKRLEPIRGIYQHMSGLEKGGVTKDTVQAFFANNFGMRSWFKLLTTRMKGNARTEMEQANRDLLRRINRSSQNENLALATLQENFRTALSEFYGVDAAKAMRELSKRKAEYRKYSNHGENLSKQQLIQLYVSAVQDHYKENAKQHNRNPEKMAKEFTEADWGLINWLQDYYREIRTPLDELTREITGLGMEDQEPLYMPVRMLRDPGGVPEVHQSSNIVPPHLTPRQVTGLDFDEETGVIDLFMQRATTDNHYLHWAKTAMELRGVFAHGDVQAAIQHGLGSKQLSGFLNAMTDTMSGGYNPDQDQTGKVGERAIANLRNYWIFSKFNLNARIGLKQMTSIPAFGLEIGLRRTAMYTATAFTPEGFEAMKEIANSPLARERRATGFTEELQHALNSMTPTQLQKWMQAATVFNRYGDLIPTLIVGQGIYRSEFQELYGNGMALDKAKKEAMSRLFEIVESTQQSGQIKDFSYWQRRKGTLGRILSTFTNTQRQFLEKEITTAINLLENMDSKDAWREAGRVAVINHVMLPAAYAGMNMLINSILGHVPEEDEWWAALASMISGPAAGFIVFGAIVNAMTQTALTGEVSMYTALTPFDGVVKDSARFAALLHHMVSLDETEMVDILDGIGKSFLPPYRELRKYQESE